MATVQGIYLALFGRPADPAGLAYFNGITNNGANLAGISNLSGQPEYLSRFTGLTNEQIVNTIFQSLFGRDAEPAGLSFYGGQLAAGKLSINTIAINILDGAAGTDKTTIDAKIAAANLFTTSIDTPAEIAAYSGDAAAALARNYISGINANNPGTEAGVNAVIQTVVTSGGQEPGGGGGGGGGSAPTFLELAQADAQDILAKWKALDAAYTYIQHFGGPGAGNPALFGQYSDSTPITGSAFGVTRGEAALGVNTAIVELSIRYANLIEHYPSVALVDEVAKEGGGRLQSVHDNILGSISEVNNIGMPERNFPTELQDRFDAEIAAISSERDYTERPLYSGHAVAQGGPVHDAIRAFDWKLGVERSDYVDTVHNATVDSAAINGNEMYFGNGNSPDGFQVERHEGRGVEVALQIIERGQGDEYTHSLSDGVMVYDVDAGHGSANWGTPAKWSFNFSIVTGSNGATDKVNLEDYNFKLSLDTDKSADTNFTEFFLTKVGDNAYVWKTSDGNVVFGGDEFVSTQVAQNSVNIGFNQLNSLFEEYKDDGDGYGAGQFDIKLEAFTLDNADVAFIGTAVQANVVDVP